AVSVYSAALSPPSSHLRAGCCCPLLDRTGAPGTLTESLLETSTAIRSRKAKWGQKLAALFENLKQAFRATTDEAFIRSEVNGRRSRRIVLFAFFCADAIGATLWAWWCENGK
ncbi:unnamed protein product, partial [Polarella glacialis]